MAVNNFMKRIVGRAKKYIVPILALPLVLGLLGYIFPKGNSPSNYKASVTISTGNYGDPLYTKTKEVSVLFKSEPFLKEVFPEMDEEELTDMKDKLLVEIRSDTVFNLSYLGADQKETFTVLEKIRDTFFKKDKNQFLKREQVIDKNIKALKNESVSHDSKVDKQRFLYDLETRKLEMKAAEEIEPLTALDSGGVGMTPKKRAVLGVLIGLALSFFIIVVPEVFREA
ncbi:hypothetical protein PJ311_02625 [Bacillus sp. CLL-7-23]|uniref:Teichuronic acid biosynthesis protein TuaF n=1 Tax=Bacillus changyiensis TaxID=3004103 RepID=A0ABT4WZN8_9BACI|nr:hypothetical protein [Bacillus changyiensis]MDA7025503.1 hypothetical protein [Bacillus changyiensis]